MLYLFGIKQKLLLLTSSQNHLVAYVNHSPTSLNPFKKISSESFLLMYCKLIPRGISLYFVHYDCCLQRSGSSIY